MWKRREINMAKSSIVEKNAITIKGILGVNEDENTIVVELEDGQAIELASTLGHFDGADVTINVSNTIER
jgi:hypothetical protein